MCSRHSSFLIPKDLHGASDYRKCLVRKRSLARGDVLCTLPKDGPMVHKVPQTLYSDPRDNVVKRRGDLGFHRCSSRS